MTPVLLMERLKEYLQVITEDVILGELQWRPNIYMIALPLRDTPENNLTQTEERDERWPFITIAYSNSIDNENGYRTITIDFTFGCEGKGPEECIDVLNLMEHVRISLLKETWEGWPFRLSRPLSMGLKEEQADSYWEGYMSTTWDVPSIVQEVWKDGF
ncbi:hypothetical protein D3C76_187350 [compost metagenome]